MIRLVPDPPRPSCAGYALDAVLVACDDVDDVEVRLQLGQDLGIYLAQPAAPGDRLRLFLVDGAAFHVDEPVLEADPFAFDLPPTTWQGELGALADGSTVVAVTLAASAAPAGYRFEVVRRLPGGDQRTTVLAWQAPAAPPAPPPAPADAAATTALIDGLIDAFHRWDDPDRVAARAAREAAQDARTAAILARHDEPRAAPAPGEPVRRRVPAAPVEAPPPPRPPATLAAPPHAALLAACRAAPADDAPRLAWAAAVGGERGELVALQCALAREPDAPPAETLARRRRVRALLDAHGAAWSGLAGVAQQVRFERGFVDAAALPAEAWAARGAELRAAAPLLTSLWPTDLVGYGGEAHGVLARLDALLADAALADVAALDLHGVATEIDDDDDTWVAGLGGEVTARLLAGGALPRLRGLALGTVGADELRALGAQDLSRLEVLHVASGQGTDAWRALLAAGPPLRALHLGIDRGAQVSLPALLDALPPTLVDLALPQLPARDLAALAAHPLAARLERLCVRDGELGDLHLLAAFPRLRTLELTGTSGTLPAALAAADLPALRELAPPSLTTLDALAATMARLGPQLALLDLRGLLPYASHGERDQLRVLVNRHAPGIAGAVLRADAPAPARLLHLGRDRGAAYWDHVTLA